MIPLSVPSIDDCEIRSVAEVLWSGWLTHGQKNEEFEEKFARYIGVKRAVSLNSCTSALFLAILAQGIKGEVIVPSFTFVASANAIVAAGATPVFVDIDYDTCNLDPSKIEERITPRTEAIMPVHFAGQSCRMNEIMEIAERHRLAVIEDSAEAIGAEFEGKKTGSFSVGCFSFFPTKNITTGEGGMLVTNDTDLAEKVRCYSAHGIPRSTLAREKEAEPWFRAAVSAGYNFRMSNILAAIGVEQLKKLDEMNELRRQHARYLNRRLAPVEGIDLPLEAEDCYHVYQMYTIKLRNISRPEFIRSLRQRGVAASVHFDPPVHQQPYYQKCGYQDSGLVATNKVSSSIVTLPMYPQLTEEQLDLIATSIADTVTESEKGT